MSMTNLNVIRFLGRNLAVLKGLETEKSVTQRLETRFLRDDDAGSYTRF
jgi:hypothetical protein